AGQCNTGPVQCCNSVQSASSLSYLQALALSPASLAAVVQNPTAMVGLTCTPLNVIGVGSGANCCENNSFSGLIAIGCTPINIAL
ncbi:hypothetical protein BD410DRAFT_725764, partial [Rickenella mellea]